MIFLACLCYHSPRFLREFIWRIKWVRNWVRFFSITGSEADADDRDGVDGRVHDVRGAGRLVGSDLHHVRRVHLHGGRNRNVLPSHVLH